MKENYGRYIVLHRFLSLFPRNTKITIFDCLESEEPLISHTEISNAIKSKIYLDMKLHDRYIESANLESYTHHIFIILYDKDEV